MANNLTGDYEAVLEVSLRQINSLLATLHQNGAQGSGLSPSFPHSVRNVQVGDTPAYLQPAQKHFGEWLSKAVQSAQASYAGSHRLTADELAAKAPPGLAVRFRSSVADYRAAYTGAVATGSVRGRAEVQISNPTISVAPGSSFQVIVGVEIRARFVPDPGSASLPEPIHGQIRITYRVHPTVKDGKPVLAVEVPTQDSQIVFTDLVGLSPASVAAITERVRASVRKDFKPETVELPPDFRFFEFKEIGGGQAIAIPLQVSSAPPPVGGLGSVTNAFLDANADDFAIALSREALAAQLESVLTQLRAIQQKLVPTDIPDVTYRLSVTSANLNFHHGYIDLAITADATTPSAAPDFLDIGVSQRLKLVLNVASQTVDLQASDSDLSITNIDIELVEDAAREEIIALRNKILDPEPPTKPPEDALNIKLGDARRLLNEALSRFDKSSSARYTAIEVDPDGIILRGAIDTKYHYQPQMQIGYTDTGSAFSALDCWIPGGRVASHTWYWVEAPILLTSDGHPWTIPWFGQQKSLTDPHRFTMDIPAAIKGNPTWAKNVCLLIEGSQIDSQGHVAPISGFDKSGTCEVTSHEPILVVDPVWEAIYGVQWGPRPPEPDLILEEMITAHINVLAHPRPASGLTTNAVIHFVGGRAQEPLRMLGQALAGMRRPNAAITVVVVMPTGAFRAHAGEVQATLGLRGDVLFRERGGTQARLLITEDYGGSWARTFDVRRTPASYLMNARGEFVWRQDEAMDAEALGRAMDEHFLEAPAPTARPLRLSVQPGERAPDAPAEEGGHLLGLHRLRGRSALVTFWQSWSAPCIRELRRLQRVHEAGGDRAPAILAVNGGEEPGALEAVRREHRLTFALVPDQGQRIARLYDVSCWPTTVSIDPDGTVDRIQFGATPAYRGAERRAAVS